MREESKSTDCKRKQPKRQQRVIPAKCRRIIEYAIAIVCLTGLAAQVILLVRQYMQRKTVVSLDFETVWYNRLPAITICYPNLIAMNKTVQMFPQLKPVFENYKQRLSKVSNHDFHNVSLIRELNSLYENQFAGFVRQKRLSMAQMAELAIPFAFPRKSSRFASTRTVRPILIKATGLRRYEDESIVTDEVEDKSPIETVIFDDPVSGYGERKCFTFFSHLKRDTRSYQMDLKDITIRIGHHEDWFPPTVYNHSIKKYLFSMHSPNAIPQNIDTFMELKAGIHYEIRYNRWKTKLLGPPRQTNCLEYDIDARTGHKLRSDCINNCITKAIDQVCFDCDSGHNKSRCEPCFINSLYLWRMDVARVDQDVNRVLCSSLDEDLPRDNMDFKACVDANQEEISHKCEKSCPSECLNRYYNFAIFNRDESTEDWKYADSNWGVETFIHIGHNQLPDQTTEHIEEMTFVNFAGAFGGLFGVWMGLSAYAILLYLVKIIPSEPKSLS